METITVNGKTYYSAPQEIVGEWKIVVLQRGWIVVGCLERNGSQCKLHNAAVIRQWGTTKGLGEIAKDGPTKNTILDKCNGLVEFDYLTTIFSIDIEREKWQGHL